MSETEYQPLTLKNQTSHGNTVKVGHLVRTDLGRIDVTVVKVQEPGSKGFYSVRVGSVEAGVVIIKGVGYWGIRSHNADGRQSDFGRQHQPNGYVHYSPLVEAVERVVNEWATSVWYAQQKTAAAAEQA